MRRIVFVMVALLALGAGVASAQTFTWQLQVFQVGVNPATGGPFYTLDLPTAVVTCSATLTMPALPPTPPANPRYVYWTQAELPGQVCRGDLSGQASFVALPVGGPYPIAMLATNEVGASPRGVGENPFRRVDPPAAPSVIRLIRQ